MQKNSPVNAAPCSDISELTQSTAAARPPARTRAPREPDGRTHGEDSPGVPLTNRTPVTYNPEKTQLLRFGVDSLYLSTLNRNVRFPAK